VLLAREAETRDSLFHADRAAMATKRGVVQ
jgi:hypothetical protein